MLPTTLRRIIAQELPRRDGEVWLQARELTQSDTLSCSFSTVGTWVLPTKENSLLCVVTMPEWRHGWRSVIQNQYLEDCVSWFFHYASAYVARSRATGAQGAIALVYGRDCSFVHSPHVTSTKVTQSDQGSSMQEALTNVCRERVDLSTQLGRAPRGRERELKTWAKEINSLDPYVHRAIFQYLRSLRLVQHEFFEEAVTALDGVVSVAAQFVTDRFKAQGDQRTHLYSAFEVSDCERRTFGRLYDLRSFFGAHPGRSSWWDFPEIYGEEIDNFLQLVRKLIWKLCQYERSRRLVQRDPASWSSWFAQHAPMVWDSVWHLPA